ncbi:uncharacterized protein KY384_006329 [Bacidia gigantensis]|uniref:uncharacterized protein n=1 Tax=Bacidia gigantensis TaxID=2732470 RepID=UPI001D043789|nr:uncharacterized protein KY384_006329 [Bacidia gigantensis]KAG8528642.1 hypothetical protein KY384_006329 [Bacidia gigantensis]
MPSIQNLLSRSSIASVSHSLIKRVKISTNKNSPQALKDSLKQDPWGKSGKYALGWVYFCVVLFVFTFGLHWYHYWNDKIGRATYKEEIAKSSKTSSPDTDYELANMPTNCSHRRFFPREGDLKQHTTTTTYTEEESTLSFGPLNKMIALVRFLVYRPLPIIRYYKKREFSFPGVGAIIVIFAATAFVTLYTFLPKPLYYATIAFGSPPLAIRAGMLAVAMMPWIIALSMKSNAISWMTGIGHERLNVLHRWGAYIMLFLSLVHTIPFYVTPIWDQGGLQTFKNLFQQQFYIYGTGLAALVPLCVLCIHSLPFLRSWAYELFVTLHVPISIVYLGMLFWHCHNYLTSWNYLWATVGIWLASWLTRFFYFNWTNPRRMSWLIGEESAISILPENAVKVTIATEMKWRPGQYVYIRMPGISVFESHPFTIASLCSEDFPSEYGENYKDMALVFRPFGGFTRKVLDRALVDGPEKTYRAFIDGPYGGMRRDIASFDTVVFFAGGSGITAIVSQLLNLIKKMRDNKAMTTKIHVIWALKRPETMEWFKEELRICKEFAPPESVHCQFYVTAAKRILPGQQKIPPSPSRPLQDAIHKQIDHTFQGIASKRNSALITEAAGGDPEKEKNLKEENEDSISGLPHPTFLPQPKKAHMKHKPNLSLTTNLKVPEARDSGVNGFDFGFPSTPTMLQKNIMRFAFLPSMNPKKSSWSTEYGRPDIPYMLKDLERDFGKKTCVFVCGPPSMRVDVQKCVANLQTTVWSKGREEIYLHTENYAL